MLPKVSPPPEPDRLEVAKQIVRSVLSGAQTPANARPLFEDDLLYFAVATLRKLDPAWLSDALAEGGPGHRLVAQCVPSGEELPLPRPAPEPRSRRFVRGSDELGPRPAADPELHEALLGEAIVFGRRGIPLSELLGEWAAQLGEGRPEGDELQRALCERGGDPAETPLGRHPGAAEVAALLGDLAWLALRAGGSGRLTRLILAYAAERVGVPYPCFDRDDARAWREPRRLGLRLLMAGKLRDAVYGLSGDVLPRIAGDEGATRHGLPEGPELLVEWHELQPAEACWSSLWWLERESLPEAHWIRQSGLVLVDEDGEERRFGDARALEDWLSDEGYAAYEALLGADEVPFALEPPLTWPPRG